MLKLRFKSNALNAVWLVEPKVTLGRRSDCHMVLSDPKAQDHHADVLVVGEQVSLQLLGEAGDTFINDRRINAARAYPLVLNDVVRIGSQELQLVDPKQEPRPTASERPTGTGWALKSNSAALSNRVYPLGQSVVVGRANECDITLAAAHLSRRHASLQVRDGLLYVKDLGSSNGTFLNGKKVSEARVKRGDELCFDTLSFGVIGPSDELDKTTVRSVGASSARAAGGVQASVQRRSAPVATGAAVASARTAVGAVTAAAEKVSPKPRSVVVQKTTDVTVSTRSDNGSSSDRFSGGDSFDGGSSGRGIWLGVLLLGVAIAGGWIYLRVGI